MNNGVSFRILFHNILNDRFKGLFWIYTDKIEVFLIHEMGVSNLDNGPALLAWC